MALAAPSMVHRTGDTLVVRSVVSGDALFGTSDNIDPDDDKADVTLTPAPASATGNPDDDAELPQCKIKRNYACSKCSYYTQNPRFYLYHLKNVHKEKIKVYECPSCLYASKHSQKLQRHVHMVHVMGAGRRKAAPKKTAVVPKPRPIAPRPYTRRNRQIAAEIESLKEKEETKEFVDGTEEPPLCADEGDSKVFKCSLCPFNSRSQTLVTRHERVVHLKKKFFRCIKCNYVTHMKARYTKHVKYHSMPMIKCDMCDFRTPYKWNLDRHNKNHQGDGAFKCSLCNFTADIKQSLTVHEMNHHVPPVGQAVPSKRRNRVGASDTLGIDQGRQQESEQDQDVDVLAIDEENEVPNVKDLNDSNLLKGPANRESSLSPKSKTMMKKPKTFANFNSKELTVKLGEKVINPNDMLQHKNGNVYVKRLKCRFCNYRAAWESEMARHEARVHNLGEKKKLPPRPIPNLIPIQNKVPGGVVSGQPILKIPNVKNGSPEVKPGSKSENNSMSEKDLNDICAKSCPNSSLKDFASLIGGAEAFKTKENDVSLAFSSGSSAFPVEKKYDESSSSSPVDFRKNTDVFKKKNASFFDKLKEKLMTGVNESTGSNLICTWCGHESKCLSEANRHQKIHSGKGNGNTSTCNGNALFSGAELSSTRCQHCRQRCKTSSDLFVHLQSCVEANKKSAELNQDQDQKNVKNDNQNAEIKLKEEKSDLGDNSKTTLPHPMENKVFVWNNIPERNDSDNGTVVISSDTVVPTTTAVSSTKRTPPRGESQMNNVSSSENSPGYGTVTSKNKSGSQGHNIPVPSTKDEKKNVDHSLKKVYKCPHCSFWASTASRFHVHIVGHLNKKPFECSLCAYRSNWRWDITKHIRLKTVRDASHERARVLMTDETGRRNYSKYNKYLTLMRVHEPSAESSGSGRRTKTQPDSSGSSDFLPQEQHSSSPPPSSLPAPPKLTPSPMAMRSNSLSPHSTLGMQKQSPPPLSQLRPLYPKPPPLQSALDMKRSHDLNFSEEPVKKKPNLDNKKTMWKCKKCFFRDSDKSVVLAHVKEHYGNQNGGLSKNEVKSSMEESNSVKESADVRRSQHNEEFNDYENQVPEDHNAGFNNSSEHLKCPTCPYVGRSENDLAEHIYQNHGGETPDDLFKCYFCPFYVSDKQKLIEHMNLHGLQEAEGYTSKGGRVSPKKNYAECADSSPTKRYKCSGCPYVSNSKSQFLYHKQFHRPRGAPFKCTMCSYNVTRRHLLHQHLRVHGIHVPTQKIKESGYEDMDETLDAPIDISPLDTSNMPEIPLVWVSKLGNLTKMFKCRYCPHVNIRKSNIQEHEKMHGQRTKPTIDGDSSPSHQQQHHCPDCNYVCNNAGVLSSHAKVHQGLFGQVCSLVDNTRSDEAQIKELNALLGRNEEGPPIITPDEIKKESKHVSEYNIQALEDVQENIVPDGDKLLRFCNICPARFLFQKELDIHLRFHSLNLSYRCESCSYTARQRPHLLAHYKVHTDEYQDRTTTLCKMYDMSPEYPKPKIAVIVDGPSDVGPAWVVVPPPEYPRTPEELDETLTSSNMDDESHIVTQHGNRLVHKQFSCHKCPAQFFKSVALQYHLTLHGGTGRHKCRSCDYAVKTYGNLIKHEAVHEQLEPRVKPKPKTKKNEIAVPTSGTELFRQKTEAAQKVAATQPQLPPPPPPLHIDPEFGLLMHGSPEFIYPTYLKNGRLKEKRYKCHKCPSAFEKREQYKVHLSLHGSKQRYNCERCDYSVKYYANYIQHLRKHQSNDATKAERKLSTDRSSDEHGSEDIGESTDATLEDVQMPPAIIASQRSAKSLQMSMADQQTLMLLQQRVVSSSVSAPEIVNRCPYCPYSNQRRDGVGSHVKCHSNGKTGAFTCRHCNYTVPQQHFLREHNKLHFAPIKGMRPEAYMKCDRLELWSEPVSTEPVINGENNNNKILIFKDKGGNYRTDRFLPQLPPMLLSSNDDDVSEKVYINLKTGEIENDQDAEDLKEDNKENLEIASKEEISSVKQETNVENDDVASSDHNSASSDKSAEDDDGDDDGKEFIKSGDEGGNNKEDPDEDNCDNGDNSDDITNKSCEEPAKGLRIVVKDENNVDNLNDEPMETEENDANEVETNKEEMTSCDSECSYSSANSGESEDDTNGSSSCSTTED